MFPSFPNFALFVFICQFQGFLLVQFCVHAQRPCLRVHRETTSVLEGVVECQRGTSKPLEALSVD